MSEIRNAIFKRGELATLAADYAAKIKLLGAVGDGPRLWNQSLIERYGRQGLARIKAAAWKILEKQ